MQRINEKERISILIMRGWGDLQRTYRDVQNLFNDTFRVGQQPISTSTVERTVKRFEETGHVKDRVRSGRPTVATNDDKSLEVLLSFIEDSHLSTRKAAQVHEMDNKSVHKILTKHKFHPYKMSLVQELNEDDPDRRLQFCEDMMPRIENDPNLPFNIVFSDEATFQLSGNCNRHNCRYWSDSNPFWMRESKTQYPQKINVWAGILNNRLIGPFFIEGNLNAVKYENMLQNEILPAIREIAGDNFENIWFQQDGAAPHFGLNVREYLNTVFPNRWIGRRGPIEWPARSPDLTPLDFFLWGYLKDRVFKTKPLTLNELRQRILDECAMIPEQYFTHCIESFYHRLAYCQEVDGKQFEHLLS